MPYFKLNGQPVLDSDFDGGSPTAPFQDGLGSLSVDAPSMPAGFGEAPTASVSPGLDDFPDFEEIIGHSPGTDASAGDSTAATNNSTSTSTTTQTLTASGSGLVFNNTFGSGATQALINDVDAAEAYLQSLFGNACTVNCSFDVQSLNPNFSGENSFTPIDVSYSQFVTALKSHASTPTAVAAANALSHLADPTGGAGVEVSYGEAVILGLPITTRVNPDDQIILNSRYWTSNALANNPGDAEAVIEHELSEGIMGRIGSLGTDGAWAPMDFFRFTASGQRDFTGGQDGQLTYFSVDGSSVYTGLQYHNSISSNGTFDGFDLADWDGVGADSNDQDPFGPGGPGNGDPGTLSATDIQIMQALGWAPYQTPTVAAQNFNVAANQSVPISNYFSVANPSGDNITEYEFKDSGGGSGYFTVNGVTQADNQVIIVPAANLSTVHYVGGSSPGADSLVVGVFDATMNSVDWSSSFTATTPTVVRTDTNSYGSTSLALAGGAYFLLAAGTGTGPELQYNGAPVTAGEFGSWVLLGAVQTATGYYVAWSVPGANQYTVWQTNSSGAYVSNPFPVVPANNYSLESIETTFNQDLNGDGTIGVKGTLIQTDRSTSLEQLGSNYVMLTVGTNSGPELQYNGSAVTVGQFGTWVLLGAIKTSSGYQVAWELPGTNGAANQYTVWNTDADGNYVSNPFPVVAANNYSLESIETAFNQDLNGDGTIGVKGTLIQTDGSTSLEQLGSNYVMLTVGTNSGPELQYNGAAVTAGQFGTWVLLGAVQTSSGYQVAWELPGTNGAANQYTVWNTDANGNYLSNPFPIVPANNVSLESIEKTFNQDLNGDGVIGLYAAPGTTLQVSQALSGATGAATIGSGATLDLTAADSAAVTFQASTGMLELTDPAAFSGTIFGFTGNGTLLGSDQIDLPGISFSSVHDNYLGNVLSLSDGSGDNASLNFNGSYTPSNFKLASDSHGGTIVYDPPADSPLTGADTGPFGAAGGSPPATTDDLWTQTSLGWLGSLNSSLDAASQSGLGQINGLTGFDFVGAPAGGSAGSSLPPAPSLQTWGAGAAGAMGDSSAALEQVASPVIALSTLQHT